MVTEGWIPGEICSYLINWEFPTHPDQLSSIGLELPYTTRVWLERGDGILSQLVDDFQVASKGIGVLVVFGGDVGPDCIGEE